MKRKTEVGIGPQTSSPFIVTVPSEISGLRIKYHSYVFLLSNYFRLFNVDFYNDELETNVEGGSRGLF